MGNGFFGVLNCIKIISALDEFREWLKKEYLIDSFENIFEGYKFFLDSAIRSLLNEIIYDSLLDFEEDFTFFRARFVGIRISKIPNTCEKILILKNINNYRRLIRKSVSIEDLMENLLQFKKYILIVFEKIYLDYVELSKDVHISKEFILTYNTMLYTLTYLNDTHRSYPMGYLVAILDNKITPKQLKNSFDGFKYSLQFVWYHLLGEKYYSGSLQNMHKAKTWRKLDSYFGKIQKEIMEPLENDLKINSIGIKLELLKGPISQDLLQHLLKKAKDPELNEKETLYLTLLWYYVEFIDNSQYRFFFNGVPAFIALLPGLVVLKNKFSIDEKVLICRFIHPCKVRKGNDYSYALLNESRVGFGISDYSGWIIFFDCCDDYSESGHSEFEMAENIIKEYKDKNQIEIREMTISLDKFKKYLTTKTISNELQMTSKIRLIENALHESKGLALELITYYFLSKKGFESVDWNIKFDNEQIDIILQTNQECFLMECKLNPNNLNIDEEIQKLKLRLERFKTSKKKKGMFWFWQSAKQNVINKLKKAEINYEIISELIRTNPIFKMKKLDKIKLIFQEKEFNSNNIDIEIEDLLKTF